MANYFHLSAEDLAKCLVPFHLPPITSVKPLKDGISNSNFLLESFQKKWVVKIFHQKSQAHIEEEIEIVDFLFINCAFPYVIKPLRDSSGNFLFTLHHLKGVIFPYCQGLTPALNPQTATEMGKTLGLLHLKSEQHLSLSNTTLRSYNRIGQGIEKILGEDNEGATIPSDYLQAVKQLFPSGINPIWKSISQMPTGIIHGDFYPDNILFRDHSVAAVLDFEQSGIYPFIWDIGIALGGLAYKSDSSTDLITAFISGYHRVRKLAPSEKSILTESILLGLLSIAYWRLERFFWSTLSSNKKNNYQELIALARRLQPQIASINFIN